jgi:hypothetical protein
VSGLTLLFDAVVLVLVNGFGKEDLGWNPVEVFGGGGGVQGPPLLAPFSAGAEGMVRPLVLVREERRRDQGITFDQERRLLPDTPTPTLMALIDLWEGEVEAAGFVLVTLPTARETALHPALDSAVVAHHCAWGKMRMRE